MLLRLSTRFSASPSTILSVVSVTPTAAPEPVIISAVPETPSPPSIPSVSGPPVSVSTPLPSSARRELPTTRQTGVEVVRGGQPPTVSPVPEV